MARATAFRVWTYARPGALADRPEMGETFQAQYAL
jgi:hypothetical protein